MAAAAAAAAAADEGRRRVGRRRRAAAAERQVFGGGGLPRRPAATSPAAALSAAQCETVPQHRGAGRCAVGVRTACARLRQAGIQHTTCSPSLPATPHPPYRRASGRRHRTLQIARPAGAPACPRARPHRWCSGCESSGTVYARRPLTRALAGVARLWGGRARGCGGRPGRAPTGAEGSWRTEEVGAKSPGAAAAKSTHRAATPRRHDSTTPHKAQAPAACLPEEGAQPHRAERSLRQPLRAAAVRLAAVPVAAAAATADAAAAVAAAADGAIASVTGEQLPRVGRSCAAAAAIRLGGRPTSASPLHLPAWRQAPGGALSERATGLREKGPALLCNVAASRRVL